MELKNYESVIILTPVLAEKQMQEAVASFRQLITEQGGNIIREENWGLTKLAYPITKKSTGFYHIFEYQAPGTIVAKVELAFRRDEQVLRYLTIALDKHAVLYNERRSKGEFNKPKEVKEATV